MRQLQAMNAQAAIKQAQGGGEEQAYAGVADEQRQRAQQVQDEQRQLSNQIGLSAAQGRIQTENQSQTMAEQAGHQQRQMALQHALTPPQPAQAPRGEAVSALAKQRVSQPGQQVARGPQAPVIQPPVAPRLNPTPVGGPTLPQMAPAPAPAVPSVARAPEAPVVPPVPSSAAIAAPTLTRRRLLP